MMPLSELRYDTESDAIAFCRREGSLPMTYFIRAKDVTCDDPPVWVCGWLLNAVRGRPLLRVSVRFSDFLAQTLFLATRGRARTLSCQPLTPIDVGRWLQFAKLPSWRGSLTPLAISEGEDVFVICTQSSQQVHIVIRSNRHFDRMSPDSLAQLRGQTGLVELGVAPKAMPTIDDDEDFYFSYE